MDGELGFFYLITELKINKNHISKAYNYYTHALYYQKLNGGKLIPVNKTNETVQTKYSDYEEELVESVEFKTETKFYLLSVEK